ncbi:MAG: hypothetical protein LC105_05935 [Chitinophagales bacterium]|nr:hypothetical protein [Chitinophagales bacterium]MCZ2393373.1 hypothetical protein [Chitinophagales bacterium]
MKEDSQANHLQKEDNNSKKWIKRLGAGAFMFFLIKGIAWLFVFAYAAKTCAI